MTLLEKLQITYDESCFPVHDALSMEPEYECEYCGHKDVAPAHSDDCPAVDAILAKTEIDRLSSEGREKDLCLEACRYKLEKLFDATGGRYHGGMEHSQLIKLINSVSGNQK